MELKTFRTSEIDIEKAIATEFANCGLPEYEKLTEKLLEKGQLLILFDGLDELPKERMSDMITAIQNFVDCHSKNRFMTSCRIAAYRSNFRRFTDVGIADSDDSQIESFINNWFAATSTNTNQADQEETYKRGQECLLRLNSGDYKAAKELTKTPLLLTLFCILYGRSGQFPMNRSTLYERALRVLLEEWNAAKEIPISKLYKGLDTKRKELILSQIAYDNFREDQLFFPKRSVVKQIEKLLSELLPDEKFTDGNHVLRDIEVQHGLLVERAEGVYSFSHLTIQEFLTAQHIDYENISLTEIVNNNLTDRRWQEVFLLLAGLKKADNLLLVMEEKTHSLMDTPKLQTLLDWTVQVTDTSSGDIKPLGKRAIAYSKIYAHAHALANSYAHAYTYALAIAYPQSLTIANDNLIAYVYSIINANENIIAYTYVHTIHKFINNAKWLKKYEVYRDINYVDLISEFESFKDNIPENQESKEIYRELAKQLIQTLLSTFKITLEMVNLSRSELSSLDNYLYASWLMLECKQAAVRVTPEVWQGIESRMLLPVKTG